MSESTPKNIKVKRPVFVKGWSRKSSHTRNPSSTSSAPRSPIELGNTTAETPSSIEGVVETPEQPASPRHASPPIAELRLPAMAAGTGQGFLLPELPRKETVDSEQDGEAEPSVTATEPDTAESTSDTATGDSPSVSVLQSYITATYNITFDAKNKGRDDTFSFDVYYSAKAISTHEKATQFLDRLEREWERCDEMLHTLSGTFAEAYDRRHAPPQAQDVDNAAWACRKAESVSQDLLTYLIGHQARLATKIGTDLEAPNGYLAILRPQIHVDEYETIPGESERSRQKSFSFSASKASNIASDKTALAIDPDLIQGSKGSKDKKMDVGKLKQLMERFEVPASTEDSKPSGGRGRGGSSRLPGGFPDEPEKTE